VSVVGFAFLGLEVGHEQAQDGDELVCLVHEQHAAARLIGHVDAHQRRAERQRLERQDAVVERQRQQRLTVHAGHARPRVTLRRSTTSPLGSARYAPQREVLGGRRLLVRLLEEAGFQYTPFT